MYLISLVSRRRLLQFDPSTTPDLPRPLTILVASPTTPKRDLDTQMELTSPESATSANSSIATPFPFHPLHDPPPDLDAEMEL